MVSKIIEKIKTDQAAQILFSIFLSMLLFMPIGSIDSLKNLEAVQFLSNDVFATGGQVFMNLLKMMIIPLVVLGITSGISGMSDLKTMRRMATTAVLLYLATTVLAISQGVGLAWIWDNTIGFAALDMSGLQAPETAGETGGIKAMILSMFPSNIVVAMSSGNMLGLITFSILFGIAIASLDKKTSVSLNNGVVFMNDAILQMVGIIMKLAPFGIFMLMGNIFIENGVDQLAPLVFYVIVLFTALMIHLFITYRIVFRLMTGLNASTFYKKMKPVWLFGFATASSSATIPVTLRTLEKQMGVKPSVSSFTVPLGATINMDGTAIMQGVATIFVAAMYGIDLGFAALLTVIVTATSASIGTASVRSAGTIMLAAVFASVGLPPEGVALILAVDPILDMVRTAVNLTGDAMVSVAVAKREGQLDEDVFNDPNIVLDEEIDLPSGTTTKVDGSGDSSTATSNA